MTSVRTRAFGAALAGALLCGGAVACSGGSGTSAGSKDSAASPTQVALSPVAAVRRAATKAQDITSLKYTMSGTIGTQGAIQADAAMKLKPLAMQMSMTTAKTGSEKLGVRLVGNVMYIDAGAQGAAQMGGKRWMKLDMAQLGKSSGGQNPLAGLSDQTNQDPSANLAMLEQSGDIKKVGQETVGGVNATHYAGTVSVDKLSSAKYPSAADKARVDKDVSQLKTAGVKDMTMDIWIGPDDRAVQVRERAASKQGKIDLTVHFTGYNVPVSVTAPPASQTFDMAQMLKGSTQG
jgi:hypothetical protein